MPWFSKGNVVACVFELKKELQPFIKGVRRLKTNSLITAFCSNWHIWASEYQGPETTAINAFIQKLENWKHQTEGGVFSPLQKLSELLGAQPINPKLKWNITTHLTVLKVEFEQYSPNLVPKSLKLLKNPFQAKVDDLENHQDTGA